nr:MAG TPA: hypothetical protein [Caudoviricetes sp.]
MKMPLSRGISMLLKIRYERRADIFNGLILVFLPLCSHFLWLHLYRSKD